MLFGFFVDLVPVFQADRHFVRSGLLRLFLCFAAFCQWRAQLYHDRFVFQADQAQNGAVALSKQKQSAGRFFFYGAADNLRRRVAAGRFRYFFGGDVRYADQSAGLYAQTVGLSGAGQDIDQRRYV